MDGSDQVRQREADATVREAALDARESSLRDREDAEGHRTQEQQGILDDADERDDRADVRDTVADARDRAASLHSFRSDEDGSAGLKARRSAGLDRVDAKSDRTLSAEDRAKLTQPSETDQARPPE